MLEAPQHSMNECNYPETGPVCSVSQIKHDTLVMFMGTGTNKHEKIMSNDWHHSPVKSLSVFINRVMTHLKKKKNTLILKKAHSL